MCAGLLRVVPYQNALFSPSPVKGEGRCWVPRPPSCLPQSALPEGEGMRAQVAAQDADETLPGRAFSNAVAAWKW